LYETSGENIGYKAFVQKIPGLFLRLIAGEFASVFVNGQRAIPRKLLDNGFRFMYSDIEDALLELINHK